MELPMSASPEHLVKAFSDELRVLRDLTLQLARLAAVQVGDAINSLGHADRDLAGKVIEREPEADRLRVRDRGPGRSALCFAAAVGRRSARVRAALRAANELERICD
jgi:phosphate transport system protein